MDETGSKNVPLIRLDDKIEITALSIGVFDGNFLPSQLIYAGKTKCSHPQGIQFPSEWDVTRNMKHWSNENTMLEYREMAIKPCNEKIIQELDLHKILLSNVFRAHLVDSCKEWQASNNMSIFVYLQTAQINISP